MSTGRRRARFASAPDSVPRQPYASTLLDLRQPLAQLSQFLIAFHILIACISRVIGDQPIS